MHYFENEDHRGSFQGIQLIDQTTYTPYFNELDQVVWIFVNDRSAYTSADVVSRSLNAFANRIQEVLEGRLVPSNIVQQCSICPTRLKSFTVDELSALVLRLDIAETVEQLDEVSARLRENLILKMANREGLEPSTCGYKWTPKSRTVREIREIVPACDAPTQLEKRNTPLLPLAIVPYK